MSNVLFIPSNRKVWIDFAQLLESKGAKIKMWVGPCSLDNIASGTFPDCTIYDFYKSHRGNTGVENILHSASKEILGDPRFYILKDKAYKIMDRQDDLRVFSRLERESLFYTIFNSYYSEIIEHKIETFICGEAPHSTVGIIIYGICELLDIPRYHLMGSSVIPAGHVCKDFYGQRIAVSTLNSSLKKEFKNQLELFIDSFSSIVDEPLYMKNQKKFDQKTDEFLGIIYKAKILSQGIRHSRKKRLAKNYSINSNYYLDGNRPSVFSHFKFDKLRSRLFERYQKFTTDVDLNQEFVYFPLHFEPEKTSNPDGGYFYQVYDSISALRNLVPTHIPIYIKEHYSQFSRMLPGHRGKSPYLYDVLAALPNVYLIDTSISSNVLINKALVTVSQTGSACLEAACSGSKAILMGYTWFNDVSNIMNFSDINNFEEVLNTPIASKDDIKSSMFDWVDNYAIPMIISPSNLDYFKQKFGDEKLSMLFSDLEMITQFVDAIWSDIKKDV